VPGTYVEDRHRFHAESDPNFHVDSDPDPDWHQNDAFSHADPSPSLTHVGNPNFSLLLVTTLPVYNVLSFSSVSQMS
jgi:hypothetical protein